MRSRNKSRLISRLNAYMMDRAKNDNEYKHWWGAFFGGFTKNQKISAAKALINYIKNDNALLELIPHVKVLEQGMLGKLMENFKEEFPHKKIAMETEIAYLKNQSSPSYSSYYDESGYDSDTSERIQGRCSKD